MSKNTYELTKYLELLGRVLTVIDCRFTGKGKKNFKDDILQTLCKLKITD